MNSDECFEINLVWCTCIKLLLYFRGNVNKTGKCLNILAVQCLRLGCEHFGVNCESCNIPEIGY